MTKVLLVEDDNNLREIYEARLAAEGYEISTAKDGEDALAVAKQQKPDLIISDVMMPRISGFEMLDILRNTDGLKHTKIIMLTALGQAEDKTRADSLGADRYLVKSQVTLEDIVKAADELLNPEAYADENKDETAQDSSFSQQAAAPLATAATSAPAPAPAATPQVQAPVAPSAPAVSTPVADPSLVAPSLQVPPAAPVSPVAAASTTQPQATPQLAPDLTAPAVAPVVAPQAAPVVTPDPVPAPPVAVVPIVEPSAPVAATSTTPDPAVAVAETPVAEPPVSALTDEPNNPVVQMPAPPVDPELAAVTQQVQTAAQEEATIEAQIEDFAQHVQPAQEVEPTPAPAPTQDEAENEALIDSAANELHNAEPSADIKPVDLPSKKVITPPEPDGKPDIAELAAQEEASQNAAGSVVAPSAPPAPQESAPAQAVPAPAGAPEAPQTPIAPEVAPTQAVVTPTETPVIPVVEPGAAPATQPKKEEANQPVGPVPESVFTPNQGNSANDSAL